MYGGFLVRIGWAFVKDRFQLRLLTGMNLERIVCEFGKDRLDIW